MAGWTKLHRSIQNHWIWEDPVRLKWWLDLILMANHQENKILVNGELITIGVGERLTSEEKLANRWNCSRNTVRKFFKLLEKDGMISVTKSRQTGTTYKVLNYNVYQSSNGEEKQRNEQRTEQQKDNGLNNELNINKNDKELKNEKNEKNIIINPLQFYEQNGFGTIAPMIVEQVGDWVSEFEQAGNTKEEANLLITKAMEFGVTANARKWGYVNKILMNWKQRGLVTMDKVEAAEAQRAQELEAKKAKPNYSKPPARKESLPEWADETKPKEKDKKISVEEQAAFKERLQKIRAQREG